MAFLQKLESSFEHVLLYEDTLLQQKALSLMPLQSMKEKAHIQLEKLTEEGVFVVVTNILDIDIL